MYTVWTDFYRLQHIQEECGSYMIYVYYLTMNEKAVPFNFFTEVNHFVLVFVQMSKMKRGDHIIVSNFSSFFTLRIDATNNAKKMPASSVGGKNWTSQERTC